MCRSGDSNPKHINEEDTFHGKKITLTFEDHQACKPLDVLELEEEQRELEHVIAELQYKERLIIALYYYEGMRLREIAKVIKLSESRVSQLHHEALLSIRAKVYKSKTVENLN
jgi:RNA polymerase sigma factor for flagellar operon FliA